MHLLLWAKDSEPQLRAELTQTFPGARTKSRQSLLLEPDFDIAAGQRLPDLVFARQLIPNARAVHPESIRAWASEVFASIVGVVPETEPWALQIEPHYGGRVTHRIGARAWHSATRHGSVAGPHAPGPKHRAAEAEAGRQRCLLIREAVIELLQRKRRHLLRALRRETTPFGASDSVVQVLLTAPGSGFISVATAPMPFEQRHLISAFPRGEVPVAADKSAPSRAFAKLVEAELRLGRSIKAGETCVDLGASPGSWTHVATGRGACVVAVDRSPLRDDLMGNRNVQFHQADAFRYKPARSVDWLLCDVIAEPERTARLLLDWLRRGWCRHFVVTLKLRDAPGDDVLATLKRELPSLTSERRLARLSANKKEACAFGAAV